MLVPNEAQPAAEAIKAWRDGDPAVTGVCAYNDNTALAVLAGLRILGLSAPDDLAVIGVDDIPAARLGAPLLTTVTIDHPAVANHIARTIITALAHQPAPRPLNPTSSCCSATRRDPQNPTPAAGAGLDDAQTGAADATRQ